MSTGVYEQVGGKEIVVSAESMNQLLQLMFKMINSALEHRNYLIQDMEKMKEQLKDMGFEVSPIENEQEKDVNKTLEKDSDLKERDTKSLDNKNLSKERRELPPILDVDLER